MPSSSPRPRRRSWNRKLLRRSRATPASTTRRSCWRRASGPCWPRLRRPVRTVRPGWTARPSRAGTEPTEPTARTEWTGRPITPTAATDARAPPGARRSVETPATVVMDRTAAHRPPTRAAMEASEAAPRQATGAVAGTAAMPIGPGRASPTRGAAGTEAAVVTQARPRRALAGTAGPAETVRLPAARVLRPAPELPREASPVRVVPAALAPPPGSRERAATHRPWMAEPQAALAASVVVVLRRSEPLPPSGGAPGRRWRGGPCRSPDRGPSGLGAPPRWPGPELHAVARDPAMDCPTGAPRPGRVAAGPSACSGRRRGDAYPGAGPPGAGRRHAPQSSQPPDSTRSAPTT